MKEHKLYKKYEPKARTFKIAAQMIVGCLIVLSLAAKMLLNFLETSDNWVGETSNKWIVIKDLLHNHPLEIVAFWLAVSAGLELAYMLFTGGPDEAVEPLILGLTSAALLVISGASIDKVSWGLAATILSLVVSIGFMFWVRERFKISKSTTTEEEKGSPNPSLTKQADKQKEEKETDSPSSVPENNG